MSAEDLICDLLIVIFYYYYYIYLISMQGSCTNTSHCSLKVMLSCVRWGAEGSKDSLFPVCPMRKSQHHLSGRTTSLDSWWYTRMVLDKFIEILLKLVATMMGTPARKKCHAQKVSTESQNVYDSGEVPLLMIHSSVTWMTQTRITDGVHLMYLFALTHHNDSDSIVQSDI